MNAMMNAHTGLLESTSHECEFLFSIFDVIRKGKLHQKKAYGQIVANQNRAAKQKQRKKRKKEMRTHT